MKYYFKYQTRAFDLWQLSMYGIYGSILGVVNIIFTIAMMLLIMKFWVSANMVIKIVLILGLGLFTIIQPLVVYLKAQKQVDKSGGDVVLRCDDQGIHVKMNRQTSDLKWNAIKGIIKKPTLLVILSTKQHGFILTNKVLGNQKQNLYNDIILKIKS